MTPEGFSTKVPGLRLAWDASCLSAYMQDPLQYSWKNIQGFRHVGFASAREWGTFYHEAVGHFEHQVHKGVPREVALRKTIKLLIPAAIEMGFPIRGEKGDAAKRSVYTLVRSLIWFEAEYRDRPLPPLELANGRCALEYNFCLPLGMKASTGEDYLLVGNIDKIGTDADGYQYCVERKTTTTTLGPYFFTKYDPCMQTYLYDVVAAILFPKARLRGVIVEACQTAVDFTRFDRHPIERTPRQRAHWLEVIKYWIKRAEQDALDNSWDRAINSEGGFASVFKDVQRRDPSVWTAMLRTELSREPLWNPLVPRPPLLGDDE